MPHCELNNFFISQETSLGIGGITITPERANIVTFTKPYIFSPVTFVTSPAAKSRITEQFAIIFYALSVEIWLAITIALIATYLIVNLFLRKTTSDKRNKREIFLPLLLSPLTRQTIPQRHYKGN